MLHSSVKIGGSVRLALVLAAVVALPSILPAADAPLRTFLEAYCVSCHDAATKKGGLDLEKLSADFKEPAGFDAWVKIHDQVQSGAMPPKKHKQQPEKAEAEAVVKGLAAALTDAERARRAGDGRAVFRRLNRNEYENTLRDLLGIPGLKVKELLPDDGRAFGFDKSAAGLDISHVQMAKYMEAAEVALDAAIAPHAARPAVYKAHIYGGCNELARPASNGETVFLKNFKYDDSLTPIPRERDKEAAKALHAKLPYAGTIGMFRTEDESFKPKFPFTAMYAGRYKLRMSVWSYWWDKGEVKPNPRTEAASLVTEGRTLGYFDAPSLKPTVTEIEVWLNAMTKGGRNQIQFNAASLWPAQIYNRKGLAAEYVGPGIAIDWLEVEGPLLDEWPSVGHRRLFGDLPFVPIQAAPKRKGKKKGEEPEGDDLHAPHRPAKDALVQNRGKDKIYITDLGKLPSSVEYATVASKDPEADAGRLLADFLPRAFRRPVASEEIQEYVGMVKVRLDEGDVFEVAMRRTYQAALCSPDFLFLKETVGQLDAWALASRLSYFLWNSMPDDELLALAAKGQIHNPAVLRVQVERMLKDPKAERFVNDFTDQWLDLREFDDTTPDKKLYPEFRPILHDSMLAESRAFFHELLDQDLPTANVVQSDFAMLNQRLAEHYRIPGVVGSALRRVPLPADSHRGGFLSQAAILKVTANGTTTSPVKRGVWVQRKIVGQPPEPQPADVPAIEPDVQGVTTIRDILAKHRSNASCAACHAKIDPPGFALENYDVIGGWQTRYRSVGEGDVPDPALTNGRKVKYMVALKVDAAGETADGRAFADVDGFKKLLLAEPKLVARNLVGQLLTYATGAPVGFADRTAVEAVLSRTAASQYGIRSLIHEIVQSPLFLTK